MYYGRKQTLIVIRTDIKGFFESIPQQILLKIINGNPHIAKKTIGCIFSILSQFNTLKAGTSLPNYGIPRGIGISSFMSEIVMREFDLYIKRLPNVMFYSRYVDDIFIILSHLEPNTTIDDFFTSISNSVQLNGLNFHPKGSGKTQLVIYEPNVGKDIDLQYLGYNIRFKPSSQKIEFLLSDKRQQRLKDRIDRAFDHFYALYKIDPRNARKDLIDCINLLSGNVPLHKTKHGIMTGLYYTNDLLSENSKQLENITKYLKNKLEQLKNLISPNPFGGIDARDAYIERISQKLIKVDFLKRWEKRKTYSFSISRMNQLSIILGA